MIEQVFIINGSGFSGKDTFVEYVTKELDVKNVLVLNYSSVTLVKKIAQIIGWNGEKTEKDRKFLSDLKLLTTEYNNMPFNDMKEAIENFYNFTPHSDKIVFLHIREPEEIEKAAKAFNANTILVTRDSIEHITSNMADANVYNYDYDIIIENNGTLEDLGLLAKSFVEDFLNNYLQERY